MVLRVNLRVLNFASCRTWVRRPRHIYLPQLILGDVNMNFLHMCIIEL